MALPASVEAEDQDIPAPRVSREDTRTVVWLVGEQDFSTRSVLAETLANAVSDDQASLVIDLRDVSFIDAAIVGAITRGRDSLRRLSRELTVRAPSRCALRVLEVCGLSGLIEPAPAAATHDPRPFVRPGGIRSPAHAVRGVT